MLKNTAKFTKSELIAIFGEQSLINIGEGFKCIGVSTDSREINLENMFIALKGEIIDGHTKIPDAFGKGASVALIEKEWYESNYHIIKGKPVILVQNTLTALGKLGSFHRKRFEYPVIAVAGSNGKTTTKEMIAHILSQKYNVLRTYFNFNNQIGVPLMLLQMNEGFNMAVFEIGTNEPGEISILTNIVAPTHGIITNIGEEHLEKLIDLDGVELEETYLYGYLKKRNGMAFINLDDDKLSRYTSLLDRKVTFSVNGEADISANIKLDEELHPIINFKERELTIKFKTISYTTGLNSVAAFSVAQYFDLSNEQLKSGMESYSQDNSHDYGRMLLEKCQGITVINDCYNANPASMRAALETLNNYNTKGQKFAVLGDMLELGASSDFEHIRLLNSSQIAADFVFVTGSEMAKAFEKVDYHGIINLFKSKEELINNLIPGLHPGDAVLVKGSRGMKMETIILAIKERFK